MILRYGIASGAQLTALLALLQTNIQTAITPEITSLFANESLSLKRLVARYGCVNVGIK